MNNELVIKISGLNLNRILDKLIEKGVFVNRVKFSGASLKFSIDEKNLILLQNVCEKEHKQFEILKKLGLKNLFVKLRFCFGFVFAWCLSICYLFAFSPFVFKVNLHVVGDDFYEVEKVNEVFKLNGIKNGMNKNSFSEFEIEKLVMESLDDLSGCTADFSGGKLNVFVYPAVKEIAKPVTEVVSKHDAVISKIEVFAGESKVAVGDVVKAGDVLIFGSDGADGKIEGLVYVVATKIYSENVVSYRKTGKKHVLKNYKLFDKYIIKTKNMCKFSSYLIEKCDFYLTENYFLPIVCEEFVFYETVLEEKIVPFETVEKQIMNDVYNEALKMVKNVVDIKNVSYSVVKEGGFARVDCFLEVNAVLN